MTETRALRILGPDGTALADPAYTADYRAAEKAGPFRVGGLGLYYRDLTKLRCVPLAQIDHAFTRVVATATHCCCGNMDLNTFRLVVCGQERELAAIYADDERYVDRAQALLAARIPGLRLGYTAPEAQ